MDEMVRRINVQSAVVIIAASVGSLFFEEWRFALSIVVGGLVAVLNLRGIVWSATNLLGSEGAQGKMVFISVFKMFIVFAALVVLFVLKLIKVYGLLIGLTVVFFIIVKEGLLYAKKQEG